MRLVALVVSMSAAPIACGGLTPFAKGEDCLRIFSGHSDNVCAVALGPSGKQMVSGGADEKIKLWDVESGQCRRTLDGHIEWVQSVALSSDGRSLASGGRDDLVKLWDVESGELRKTFVGHSGIVTSVTYSRDGRLLASCGRDKFIKIWHVGSAKCTKTLGSVTFSPLRLCCLPPIVNKCSLVEIHFSCGTLIRANACEISRGTLIVSERSRSAGTANASYPRDRMRTKRSDCGRPSQATAFGKRIAINKEGARGR